MPISSFQVNQMMASQQAMFGNSATYARQLSNPTGMPTYAQPMGGAPSGMLETQMMQQGMGAAPGMLNAMASYGTPLMSGVGMMMGGRIGGMMDPFTGALRGFGRGAGWQSGAGFGANLGRIATGGVGSIARGLGMGAVGALPGLALQQGLQYSVGNMIGGAQFQNQTMNWMQNAFRFSNPASRTGMGFTQTGQRQVSRMFEQMGTDDVMTTATELRGIAQRGTQMDVFRGVQDAREFRKRFTEMKDALTEIASTFNTTLSEAIPFFQQARQSGFWTPRDITQHAQQVRRMQATTGMSTEQAQQMMQVGAHMVRGMGGTMQQGARMMARSQGLAGAAFQGGVFSSEELQNAGFGSGAEGAQNFGTMMAQSSARFARSRVGRWALAAMMNKEGTGLDPSRLQRFAAGGMSVGQMSSMARRNVSGGRAYQFVMNEENLRGQLAEAGPNAQLGFIRSITGGRLYGDSGRDRLVTNRIIRRFTGGNKRQAEMMARMAREMPRITAMESARSESSLDTQEQQRERMMSNRLEQFRRGVGQWWQQNITDPLRQVGADFSFQVGRTVQRFTDRLFGTQGLGKGIQAETVRAMAMAARTGDSSYITREVGGGGLTQRLLGGVTGGGRAADPSLMLRMGYQPEGEQEERWGGVFGGGRMQQLDRRFRAGLQQLGLGSPEDHLRFTDRQRREAAALQRGAQGLAGTAEATAMGFGGTDQLRQAQQGLGAQEIKRYLGSSEALRIRGGMGQRPGAADQYKYGQKILERIRSGAAGSAARMLVADVGDRQALARIQAFGQGAGYGEVRSFEGRLGVMSSQERSAELADQQQEATEGLVELMRETATKEGGVWDIHLGWGAGGGGGVKDVAVTERGMEALKEDSRAKRAFVLFRRAKNAKGNEKKRLLAEARAQMLTIGRDQDTPEEIRTIAIRMADKDDPNAAKLAESAGTLGETISAGAREAAEQTVQRRMSRVNRQLANSQEEIQKRTGGAEGRLNRALQSVLTAASGGVSLETQHERMRELAQAAAEDPEKAGVLYSIMEREGAGTSQLGQLMQGAIMAATVAKNVGLTDEQETAALGGRGMKGARRSVRAVLGQLIGEKGMKGLDISGLITGEAEAGAELRKKLEAGGMGKDHIKDFLKEIQGGFTKKEAVSEMTRLAQASATSAYSEKVAKEAGLDPSELRLSGKEGSFKGIHTELKVQTAVQQRMLTNLDFIARQEKKPVKSKKEK